MIDFLYDASEEKWEGGKRETLDQVDTTLDGAYAKAIYSSNKATLPLNTKRPRFVIATKKATKIEPIGAIATIATIVCCASKYDTDSRAIAGVKHERRRLGPLIRPNPRGSGTKSEDCPSLGRH